MCNMFKLNEYKIIKLMFWYLVAVDALVRPLSGVHAHVFVEAGRLRKTLSTN